ncbi:hypothetical protein DFH06DRAFT_243407 [Mycena polygramma]|nr:hypothetical protein DFH06DRAFT_243407 [Mycena polygramma]
MPPVIFIPGFLFLCLTIPIHPSLTQTRPDGARCAPAPNVLSIHIWLFGGDPRLTRGRVLAQCTAVFVYFCVIS